MKRTLATLAAAAGVLLWTGVMGAATHTVAEPAQNSALRPIAHPHPAPMPVPGQRWTEDSLPPELYLWQRVNSGDLQRWGTYDGHRNCWAAVADTTLVMCPDGWYTTT